MSVSVAARVSVDVLSDIDYVAKEKGSDKSKVIRELLSCAVRDKLVELALEKYSKRLVSLGRAAELARLPLADFMRVAAERKVPVNYSVGSLEGDFRAALRAK
ncbi:UPF0175 family protein [Candidatus Woesearchaeota archaeon]|nr:UPF0175 family protein [Candidatus Woesearchaeota archaeon]